MLLRVIQMKPITVVVLVLALFTPQGFGQSPLHLTADEERRANELEHNWKELRVKDPAAWDQFKASIVLQTQEDLAEFGYGTVFTAALDDKTKGALRKYQDRSGLPVTGDLDERTWVRIQDDKSALHPDITFGMYSFLDSDWNSSVRVRGAWVEDGKEFDANTPYQPALVDCVKSARMCMTVTANSADYLNPGYFEIERWDADEIMTKPLDLPCGRETILLTKSDRTVLDINTAKNSGACTRLLGQGHKVVSRLADPASIRGARLKALRAARDRVMLISPEAKERAGMKDH